MCSQATRIHGVRDIITARHLHRRLLLRRVLLNSSSKLFVLITHRSKDLLMNNR